MEDRELVELAAKAAGIKGIWHRKGFVAYSGWVKGIFNPLDDGGDALRLADSLEFIVDFSRFAVIEAERFYLGHRDFVLGNNVNEAITRAAAQIGKEME